jgi:hypothetical protein
MLSRRGQVRKRTAGKIAGYAFDGSNPKPATTCENGPLAANCRLCGMSPDHQFRTLVMAANASSGLCSSSGTPRDPRPGTARPPDSAAQSATAGLSAQLVDEGVNDHETDEDDKDAKRP